jgi:hypothetical protein
MRRLFVDVGEQLLRIEVANPQDQHPHTWEPGCELKGDRIVLGKRLFGIHDEPGQPRAITPCDHIAQIRPDAISPADAMTWRAYLVERDLTGLVRKLTHSTIAGSPDPRRAK